MLLKEKKKQKKTGHILSCEWLFAEWRRVTALGTGGRWKNPPTCFARLFCCHKVNTTWGLFGFTMCDNYSGRWYACCQSDVGLHGTTHWDPLHLRMLMLSHLQKWKRFALLSWVGLRCFLAFLQSRPGSICTPSPPLHATVSSNILLIKSLVWSHASCKVKLKQKHN